MAPFKGLPPEKGFPAGQNYQEDSPWTRSAADRTSLRWAGAIPKGDVSIMGAPGLQFVETFANAVPGDLQPPWQADPGSRWRISSLSRPRTNREFWPVVDSPHMHVAFPVMAACPKTGRLYVVYRQGYTHATHLSARDGAIMMVTSDDDGETWSRPRCIFDDPDIDDRNPAVGVTRDGVVVVCFDQYKRGWHPRAAYIISRDGGETWSEAQTLGDLDNLTCRSRPIELSTGEVVFPVYRYSGGLLGGYAVFVDLETGSQEQRTVCGYEEGLPPADEMTIFEVEPGQVLALLRDEWQPFLWQAWSHDYGRTWTPREPTDLPSQFAPCDLLRLADGRIACALAFRERRNERLVISEDGGRTWDVENSLDIFDATVGFDDRSYVSSAVLRDGGVGSVLYETRAYPEGGRIWFARTHPADLSLPRRPCLHHADPNATSIVSLPLDGADCTLAVQYRFTGRFGARPAGFGLRLADGSGGCVAFTYHMGIGPDRDWSRTNFWRLEAAGQAREGQAIGDSFNDGNEHTMVLEARDGRVQAALDEHPQADASCPGLRPRSLQLIAEKATVAVYRVEVWRCRSRSCIVSR